MPPTSSFAEHSSAAPARLRTALAERYELGSEIGHGGMATVYSARDLRHDRRVAIKVLPPGFATAVAAERFVFEIRTAAQLLHPHILGLIDSGEADGLLYYIMPLVEGESLREKLARERCVDLHDAVRITAEVASALAYAHAHGVIHRDIKPENILLVDGTHAMVADFGLARAIERAREGKLTDSRHILGTPHYMSPEQAGGEQSLDGRSDIYSLGCVLYEMLAGTEPFHGDALALLRQHINEPPPTFASVCRRTDVPPAVEAIVMRALEKEPAHRFQDAAELAHVLYVALPHDPANSGPRASAGLGPGLLALAGTATLVGLATLALLSPIGESVRTRALTFWAAPFDTTRYLIVPLRREPSTPAELRPELMLHDALSRWKGLSVVEQFQVSDAVARLDTSKMGDEQARQVARQLRAGRYIWGDVAAFGDSLRLHATVYDGGTGARLGDATMTVARARLYDDDPYRRLTDSLLFRGPQRADHEDIGAGTRSYEARQAYGRGHVALLEWNLAAADSAFSSAIAADRDFAEAYFWLAQTRGWMSDQPQQWRTLASSAVVRRARLPEPEQKLALALLYMADSNFPNACALYRDLRRSDPQSFAATFGLGECLRRDDLVIPDARTPSRWRFRSSRREAVNAYRDAFELLPSINRAFRARAFERIRGLLLTTTATRVTGHAAAPDTTTFFAAPMWLGDSLALIPYPTRFLVTALESTVSTTTVDAVRHQSEMFAEIAATWRRAFRDDAVPLEAVAVALELLGNPAALDTIREARRLAADDSLRVRLAVHEIELRVKFSLPDSTAGLEAARTLADSLLRDARSAPGASSEVLAAVAMLVGRGNLAATLARRGAEPARDLSALALRTLASSRALLVYAALGGPVDSLRALEQSVVADIRATILAPQQDAAVVRLLSQPAALAFPAYHSAQLQTLTERGNPVVDAQAAYLAGDMPRARQILAKLRTLRATRRASDLTIDITFAGAATLTALGDSAEARAWLDPVLDAAMLYPPQSLSRLGNAGTLPRAALLRARLARASGDTVTARRWERAVAILWKDADPQYRH